MRSNGQVAVADAVLLRVQAGQVGVALVTELEIGYSARSGADYDATRQELLEPPIVTSVACAIHAVDTARARWSSFQRLPGSESD